MDFSEALNALKKGNGIRRKFWVGDYHLHSRMIVKELGISDVLADDWEVVVETFDFSEALKRMKAGKAVSRVMFGEGVNISIKDFNANNNSVLLVDQDILATDWYEK